MWIHMWQRTMLSNTNGMAANGSNGDIGGGNQLSTSAMKHESNGSHSPFVASKAKDDTCTQTRVRHPTDRGYCPSAAPLSPTLITNGSHFFNDPTKADAYRSRAYSANARPIVTRMNIYKRPEIPNFTTKDASEKPTITKVNVVQKHSMDANGCDSEELPTAIIPKRESWLQKSWKAHRPIQKDQKNQESISNSATPGPLSGFLDRLRPRSNSDAAANSVVGQNSAALVSRRKKDGSKPGSGSSSGDSSRNATNGLNGDGEDGHCINWAFPYGTSLQKTESEPCNNIYGNGISELDTWQEEDLFDYSMMSPTATRKRSSSDATNYLIMRKTSRPTGAEVLGSLGRDDDAYKQLLTQFTCYDLMPAQGSVVVVDCQLPTRQALSSLSDNGVRAALLWDSRKRVPICFLTVTDLLRILYTYFASSVPKTPTRSYGSIHNDQPGSSKAVGAGQICTELADIMKQPILSNLIKAGSVKGKTKALTSVTIDDTLQTAAAALRSNKLHRVAVIDMDTGNPMYLLSSKRLLSFIYNHVSNLPMPSTVYKSLDDLRVGSWMDSGRIVSVFKTTTMVEAAEKFLESGVSSLPVLECCVNPAESVGQCVQEDDPNCSCKPNRLLDSLTKVDLMHFILVNGWSDLQEKTVADVLRARHPNMERPVTCHKKTPLSLAIDRMILSNAHRIYIVDSSGVLEGLLSVGDLLSYLLQ